MRPLGVNRTVYKVSDFLDWQRRGILDLNPPFQRRAVWKKSAKSYFVDTLVRGLPVPLIFLRERLDLTTQEVVREVVDGQQRIRTLLSLIDPGSLHDFDPAQDEFTVRRVHSAELAGMTFTKYPPHIQRRVLNYQFSVHVLPSDVEDRQILEIFARMNATGERLKPQELRNAEWHGAMKTLMYKLALQQLDRWRQWAVISDLNISRMKEVELVSDLTLVMMKGLQAKSQSALNRMYKDFDDELPEAPIIERRFVRVMDTIEDLLGDVLVDTAFKNEIQFVTLFCYLYDELYGLGSALQPGEPPKARRDTVKAKRQCLLSASDSISRRDLPQDVLDAITGASSDLRRRQARLDFLRDRCDGQAGQ